MIMNLIVFKKTKFKISKRKMEEETKKYTEPVENK